MNPVRPLYLAAAALFVTGVVLRVVPVGMPPVSGSLPSATVDDKATPVRVVSVSDGDDSSSVGSIIGANIFSRTRIAPIPAHRQPATVAAAQSHTPSARPSGAATFRLYGTTIGPGGAIALIDAGTAPRGAQVHRMGDTIAGARLVDITDSTVTLARGSGQVVLHIQSTGRQAP